MRPSFRLLTLALLVGATPAAADRDVHREQSERTVEVRGFRRLEVANSRGRVDLVPSPDGRLHLTALKIVRVGGRERAAEVAREIVVETRIEDDRYRIEVRYPRRRDIRISFWDLFRVDGVNVPSYEVRLTCQVPRGLPVSVRVSSGDVRSEGLASEQSLRSSSGDVVVESAEGPLEVSTSSGDATLTSVRRARVRTSSGDVAARQVAGPLRVATSSGRITVTGAEDSLALSTTSGDIRADRAPHGLEAGASSGDVRVQNASGTVRVSTASGDVRLSLREPLRGLDVGTSSGSIRLLLDPAVGGALDIQTSSGTIDVDLPLETRTVSRRHVTGAIRGGRTPMVLRTSSGDITLAGGGE